MAAFLPALMFHSNSGKSGSNNTNQLQVYRFKNNNKQHQN